MGNGPSFASGGSFHARYELGKQLGKGAQGHVHACTDRDTGGEFAVKIFDRSSKRAWTTYNREVELCKASNARHVITVWDEFVDSNHCYVVMEKFEGHLRKGLKWVARESGDGPLLGDIPLRRIMHQVLSAVVHLHRCCIVHRDVKAHNLFADCLDLRDDRCRVVLGDFGLSRRLEHGSLLYSQVGTRKYWAPELYDKKYWHVVDVFAVGVVMFLASSSFYPFLDEKQTRVRDVFADGAVPGSLDPGARDFMLMLLEKDPSKRPAADGGLFNHPWFSMHPEGCRGADSPAGNGADIPAGAPAQAPGQAPAPQCRPRGGPGAGPGQRLPLPRIRGDEADGLEINEANDMAGCCAPRNGAAAPAGASSKARGRAQCGGGAGADAQGDHTGVFIGAKPFCSAVDGGRHMEMTPVILGAL